MAIKSMEWGFDSKSRNQGPWLKVNIVGMDEYLEITKCWYTQKAVRDKKSLEIIRGTSDRTSIYPLNLSVQPGIDGVPFGYPSGLIYCPSVWSVHYECINGAWAWSRVDAWNWQSQREQNGKYVYDNYLRKSDINSALEASTQVFYDTFLELSDYLIQPEIHWRFRQLEAELQMEKLENRKTKYKVEKDRCDKALTALGV